MKIKLARTMGYCLGVRRAMDTAFSRLSRRGGAVYSHGELIHNGPALELLAQKGLKLWRGETEGDLIIRAHGLPPDELARLRALDLNISDATCPRVKRVQKLIAREAAQDRMIIIWGKADHPEVIGLVGHAGGRGRVAAGPAEVAGLPNADRVLLVAQTTQDLTRWPAMAEAVLARWPEALIRNTICEATETRQTEVHRLTREVDALVVIGGRSSGNTARLADIGRRAGLPTVLAESAADLDPADLAGAETVGVAAGASTSTWQVAQILEALRAMARSRRGFGSFWPRLLRVLVLGGLFAAMGLAALALSAGLLLGSTPPPILFSFFSFQVAALHLFRDFPKKHSRSQALALQLGDPDRTAFFAKYAWELRLLLALCAVLAALAAVQNGPRAVMVLLLTWLTALAHQFAPRPKGRPSLARTLAGPMLLAGGWAAVMVWINLPGGLQSLSNLKGLWSALFSGGAVFGHVFALAVMEDVLGFQGDRIFGRPTLTTVFGEKAAQRLLTGFLAVWALGLTVGAAASVLPPLAWVLILTGPLYNFFLLKRLFPEAGRDDLSPSLHGFRFEALRYAQLWLTGLAAWLWAVC